MKVLDYLLIIGCIVSLVACSFFVEWQRDLLRFIAVFCVGGLVGRIMQKKNQEKQIRNYGKLL